MIGQLRGIIIAKQPPLLILDVAGVGYEVHAPMSTFYKLSDSHQEIILLTHMVVREDAQLLYGFHSERERSLFRSLIKVNGVGPKLALTILSGMDVDTFVRCVQTGDISTLISIPGIGKKTAERLLVETRDAMSKWESDYTQSTLNIPAQQNLSEAISALTTLGYKPNEAKQVVSKIYQAHLSSEELIRLALKQMVAGVSA